MTSRRWISALFPLLAAVTAQASEPVFAPVFAGRPPADAVVGLTRLPDGEIRHYNYNEHANSNKPLYIFSRDSGLTWRRKLLPEGALAADSRSPLSGEFMRLSHSRGGIVVIRSKGGIDGEWESRKVEAEQCGGFRPAVFTRGGSRVLVPCASQLMSGTMYSDDDGLTWKRSNLVGAPPHRAGGVNRSARWQNGAVEPTVVELPDGRVWMLMRTSQDTLYESFSNNGGETWEAARPSRFYSTLTMPTVGRLRSGRILLVWNSTTPLPEVERGPAQKFFVGWGAIEGTWEDVFTNRDAIHAAISDDEGRSWWGFRELFLNARRNDADYAEAEITSSHDDRSVHQNQFVENADGSVLVSLGQHHLHRSLVLFHPDWLLEKKRSSRFENELEDWSVQMYIAGIRGHCAFNRKPGASLVAHPYKPGRKVLRIRRPTDPSLISENQGAVWNFPAGTSGSLTLRAMFPEGGQGGRINLLDRWVNPTDLSADTYAMYTIDVDGEGTITGNDTHLARRWHELRFEWNGLADPVRDYCRLLVDGVPQAERIALKRPSVNGINYVQLISTATREDTIGFVVESVAAEVK